MQYNTAATLGKLVGVVMIFILFYLLLQLAHPLGEAIILAILAGNLAEIKIIVSDKGD